MKFISWNVNGLRAAAGKGFSDAFKALDADFFCLQETKMQEGQFDLSFDGYTSFWNSAEKKGYSGTAIFTRKKPLSVRYGMGVEEHDHEGRIVTLEMPDFYLVCVYVPNSQDGLRRLDYRLGGKMISAVSCSASISLSSSAGTSTSPTRKLTLRILPPTDAMPDLPMKRGKNSASFLTLASRILGAHSILKKSNILGGHTASMQGRITRDGESTISSSQTRSAIKSSLQISTTRFSVRTTAPSNWCSISDYLRRVSSA